MTSTADSTSNPQPGATLATFTSAGAEAPLILTIPKPAKQPQVPWRSKICGGSKVSGTKECVHDAKGIWKCVCRKEAPYNMVLRMEFMSKAKLEKMHLKKAEKNDTAWMNFADKFYKETTNFGPPFAPLSGETLKDRMKTSLLEVAKKHDWSISAYKHESLGVETHPDITPYDAVVKSMIEAMNKESIQDAKKDKKKQDDDVNKANSIHFENQLMPGLMSGADSSLTKTTNDNADDDDDDDDCSDSEGDVDADGNPKKKLKPSKRRRLARNRHTQAEHDRLERMFEAFKETAEEKAAREAKEAKREKIQEDTLQVLKALLEDRR